jgi:hypothetical protein
MGKDGWGGFCGRCMMREIEGLREVEKRFFVKGVVQLYTTHGLTFLRKCKPPSLIIYKRMHTLPL